MTESRIGTANGRSFRQASDASAAFVMRACRIVGERLAPEGKLSAETANRRQRELHGLAWIATLSAAVTQAAARAEWLESTGAFGEIDRATLLVGFGEYLNQLAHGIPMSQNEIVRPAELGLAEAARELSRDPSVAWFLENGNTADTRLSLIDLVLSGQEPNEALGDETLDMIRQQYRRFTAERITPQAHAWHLQDALLPDDILGEMAEIGTFGVCIAEEYSGLGLGKTAMCVVTEELSRGWIAAGSIGTRSEIAGELIGSSGTAEQKARWLPGIAAGTILPTAVFTEPDTGSDLARLKTRATKQSSGDWRIDGNKTWITHASRSDLMTVLARTDPATNGYEGLSMFLVSKTRGRSDASFPDEGLSGGEIPVLGYRGMREYELAFSSMRVDEDGLLGGAVGAGFKQLMQTFEGARIQTAARALGVAFRAFELGLAYATDRKQFGQHIVTFPRVGDKLALMLAEIVMARAVTYHAAREKDEGRRCDIEAGMAKLLAARVAWSNADASLQIHGGNGYALEYEISRVLCDARILNIFEGAAEIQAHVIGRGLLSRTNA
jgi:(2S)-methylsuccinyl-CoA dehydrogenase